MEAAALWRQQPYGGTASHRPRPEEAAVGQRSFASLAPLWDAPFAYTLEILLDILLDVLRQDFDLDAVPPLPPLPPPPPPPRRPRPHRRADSQLLPPELLSLHFRGPEPTQWAAGVALGRRQPDLRSVPWSSGMGDGGVMVCA